MRWVGQTERLSYFQANQTQGARKNQYVCFEHLLIRISPCMELVGVSWLAISLSKAGFQSANLLNLLHSALQTLLLLII